MQEFKDYSTATNVTANWDRKPNKKALTGGIMAGSGAVMVVGGTFCLLLSGGGDEGQINTTLQGVGFGLVIGGAGLAIAGGVMAIIGLTEVRRQYGVQIIAPKRNEIGIAYNFK